MKSLKLLIIFTLIGSICFAQKQLPTTPVFDIKSDTAYEQILNPTYYQVLEDKGGKWTFEEVSQVPLSNLFHAKGVKVEGVDTTAVHTYWHRYRLKNTMPTTAKISVGSYADSLDVYAKKRDSSEWVHYQNGDLREWDKRDGLKSGVIMFNLSSGEEMSVYVRRYRTNETNFKTNIGFYSTEKFIKKQYDYVGSSIFQFFHLLEAFLLGLFLLTIFFNLFFYHISKEKSYLYFALFILFLGINRFWNILDVYFSWEYPSLKHYVPYLSYTWAFIPVFLIQFVRAFFKTKESYRKWDIWLITIAFANILVNILRFFNIKIPMPFFDFDKEAARYFAIVIIPICMLITFGLYIRRKERFQLYVMVGLSPLLIFYSFNRIANTMGFKLKTGIFRTIEVPCLVWLILILAWLLFMRYNHLKQKNEQRALDIERERNKLIEGQKVELERQVKERTQELEVSLIELKATQNQLIQKEKLASLGELTAGIAHEIQNPLNFVNNFSELSVDLAKDLNDEIHKPDIDKEYVEELLTDLTSNQEKINHHGKRASSIVKGMLEHSRASTGVRELTDINKLADEYLRLSYHGLRAKDKDFNADFKTGFADPLSKIEIIPQDMGRVLLNLINNAFYAVNEKRVKNTEGGYQPTVTVSTQQTDNQIIIKVKDNGTGMPKSVREKVFQPFFTTKPTGSGTGLGLSLAYDIVTKGHGGTLEVESTEGVGTAFMITLPFKTNG
jgi:two-component system, NtrC family, sensor kinase